MTQEGPLSVPDELLDGRYTLGRELGRGGVCVVREAVHRFTERPVAVKTLLREHAGNPVAAEMLLREATALGRVRHPCVVEAVDAGRAGDEPYLVMELLHGGRSLEGVLATRGTLGVAPGVRLVRRVADAIATAHERGVVHRDIKPGNVLLVRVPNPDDPSKKITAVKVIDFGLATLAHDETGAPIPADAGVVGTPEYMSLERLTAAAPSLPQGDVYALGVTLYECLTGAVPFPGSYGQVLQAAATQVAPRASEMRPGIPEAVADVIANAIAREPANRYADARALCEALDESVSDLDGLGIEPPTTDEVARRRKHARAAYITPMRVTLDGASFGARSEDISEGGILVLAPRAARLGATGEIRWALPGTSDLVTTRVLLKWVRENEMHAAAPCALGLELVEPDARVCEAIARYVAQVGPPA